MRKLLLAAASLLAAGAASAAPQPATLTVDPATTPEVLQVLDRNGIWVPLGSIDPNGHFFFAPNDVVNAVAYGADPTQTADSTPGINAAMAAAGMKCVYLPSGKYKVTDALNLAYNGCLKGDGVTASVLYADAASFNLAALGVVVVPTNNGGDGPSFRDIGIHFTQPDCSPRGAGCPVAFPPGVYAQGVARQKYTNVRISGGSYCLDARGNSNVQIVNFECGSLVKGLQMDGGLDGSHVYGWHEWDFDLISPGLKSVYGDLTNLCMEIGRVDWITIDSTQCFLTGLHWTANAASSNDSHMVSGLGIDGGWILVDGQPSTGLYFSSVQSTGDASMPASYQPIVVNGTTGAVRMVNCRISSASNSVNPPIVVTSGTLVLTSCTLNQPSPGVQAAKAAGGTLEIYSSGLSGAAGQTVPVVEQASGFLRFANNKFLSPPSGGTGIGVKFDADGSNSSLNYFGENSMGSWGLALPATVYTGVFKDFFFSAAGTALHACDSYLAGRSGLVSDASSPTYGGTYAGGGASFARVLCAGSAWRML